MQIQLYKRRYIITGVTCMSLGNEQCILMVSPEYRRQHYRQRKHCYNALQKVKHFNFLSKCVKNWTKSTQVVSAIY